MTKMEYAVGDMHCLTPVHCSQAFMQQLVGAAERPDRKLLHFQAGLSDLEQVGAHLDSTKPALQRCRLLSCSAP